MARSNPSRPRRRNRWQALSPEELQAQAAEQRIQAGGPGALPWQPHPTLVALQERLQLVADCWNLLDGTGGQSRQGLYLPQGRKEPEAAYRQRRANAWPSSFFRDALRTYAGMLASAYRREPQRGWGLTHSGGLTLPTSNPRHLPSRRPWPGCRGLKSDPSPTE